MTDNNFSPAGQNIKFFLDKVSSAVAFVTAFSFIRLYCMAGEEGFSGTRVFPSGADWLSRTAVLDV